MSEFSDVERAVYNRIRHAGGGEWTSLQQVKVTLCREFEPSEIQQAVHDLYRANLIEVDEGRYRPTDPDRRIPHPGEIDTSA